jgi:outer membrane protein assembly factor BamB
MTPASRFIPALIAVVLSLGLNTAARADNWPAFRGKNSRGIGSGKPPVTWNIESGKHIKWKSSLPGLGLSSPIIWNDRVFVTTAVHADADKPGLETGWMGGSIFPTRETGQWTWQVICLDRQTGKILWTRDAHKGEPKTKRHPKSSHANATPVTDGTHVVACFGPEGLYCYDFEGKPLWKTELPLIKSAFYFAPELGWGYASSPIIHDGQVIIQYDGTNAAMWSAFDVKTGREIRTVKRDDVATWSTPAILETGGQTHVILNGYKECAAYDLRTGRRVWTHHASGDIPVPTPQIAGDLIFITSGHSASPIFAIRADAKGDITPDPKADKPPEGMLWWQGKHGSYMPTPLVIDDRLIIPGDNGVVGCYDVRTGKEHYRERIENGGTFSASAVTADGRIYFPSEAGDVFLIDAGPEYKLIGSNAMNEPVLASPAIADGQLFIRGRDHLFCIAE